MTDDSSTYNSFDLATASVSLPIYDSVSYDVLSLVVVSILILLLLSEGNILLGIIS